MEVGFFVGLPRSEKKKKSLVFVNLTSNLKQQVELVLLITFGNHFLYMPR